MTINAMPKRPLFCKRGLVDGFVVMLLVLFALDTMPCTPQPVRQLIQPLLNVTGLWQGQWTLFAPVPDSRNHHLRAEIRFADGTQRIWQTPTWRTQSPWQRFIGHRESEFLEKIWEDDNSRAWPAFAQDLVRRERSQMDSPPEPERVILSVLWSDIPPPAGQRWPVSKVDAVPDQERVFFTLIYPQHH